MPTDLHPLARAGDLLDAVIGKLENDIDLSAGIGQATVLAKEARAALQDYHADYVPEHARPEPVATEREWIGKVRDLITGPWSNTTLPERHVFDDVLQVLRAAENDLRPEPVSVGARRALQSIRDMTLDFRSQDQAGALDSITAQRIFEAARDGLASIEQLAGRLTDAELQRMEDEATARPAPTDPDVPDPTIEVLPLPGDRFMLILSGWPMRISQEQGDKLKADSGAQAVMVTSAPVYLPDGYRTGVNAAVLAAQHTRRG